MQQRMFEAGKRKAIRIPHIALCLSSTVVLLAHPAIAQQDKHDKYWHARQEELRQTVDAKGLEHWRKWRDQHSTIWLLTDWKVPLYGTDTARKHLSVRIYRTPGAAMHKAGEQSVLKVFDGKKLLYCSDKAGDYACDELGWTEPLAYSGETGRAFRLKVGDVEEHAVRVGTK